TCDGAPFFFSGRRRHTRFSRDWSSDVCSSDLHLRSQRTLNGLKPRFVGPRVSLVVMRRDREMAQGGVGACGQDGGAGGARCDRRSEERRVGKEWRSRWATGRNESVEIGHGGAM